MNTSFDLHDDTQTMLRDSLVRYLSERYGFEERLRALAAAEHAPPPLWRGLARDLDILGSSFPEAVGGHGGGTAVNLLVMEALGGVLAAEPYLSTVVIGGGLLQGGGGGIAHELIGRIIAGQAVLAFAHAEPQSRHDLADLRTRLAEDGDGYVLQGRKAVVQAAPWATHLIVTARSHGEQRDPDGVSVLVVDRQAPGITLREYPVRDGGRAAEVQFDQVRVGSEALIGDLGGALPLLERVVDDATLAVCAESIGVLHRLLADSMDYARQRRQFGVPIASFQVLQHRMVDMYMAMEQAKALTYGVRSLLDAPAAQRSRAVSSAKVAVAKACRTVGQGAVQIHGGMGMTEEFAVGHYFRRAAVIEGLFGSVDHHLRRCERLTDALA